MYPQKIKPYVFRVPNIWTFLERLFAIHFIILYWVSWIFRNKIWIKLIDYTKYFTSQKFNFTFQMVINIFKIFIHWSLEKHPHLESLNAAKSEVYISNCIHISSQLWSKYSTFFCKEVTITPKLQSMIAINRNFWYIYFQRHEVYRLQ